METKYLLIAILSFAIAYLLIPVLRKIAIRIQLVDKPNQRKVHSSAVPLIGGISIFITTILTVMLVIKSEMNMIAYGNIFISSSILLIIGVMDDKYDIKAILKLIIQLLLAHFTFASGIKIESLHGLFGIYTLTEWAQYILTIVTITGVVNAFNLMDGIDGLAAGLSIVAFSLFALFSFMVGELLLTTIFASLIGASLAFLYFNFSKENKIFMGDAGSLTIGFFLVISAIKILQTSQEIIQISSIMFGIIAVFILPVLDALRVFRRRMKAGKSPFSADKTHLHHLVLSTGLKHKMASLSIVIFVIGLVVIGFMGFLFYGITLAISFLVLLFIAITSLLQYNDKIKLWKRRIKEIESTSANSML